MPIYSQHKKKATNLPAPQNSQFLPPKLWEEFEDLCADLFAKVWDDYNTDRYGRGGQRQNGVDIFGRPNAEISGVQCKGKSNWPQKILTEADINSEVKKALKFEPKLKELIFATTAPSDVVATDHANALTEAHRKKGLFTVHVWSWDKIIREITKYPDLVEKHFNYTSFEGVKNEVRKLREDTSKLFDVEKALPSEYADVEVVKLLKPIIDLRYIGGFGTDCLTTQLANKLLDGELRQSTAGCKAKALSWCARLLAKKNVNLAQRALATAEASGPSEESTIASAFIAAEDKQIPEALRILNDLGSPAARSASMTIISMQAEGEMAEKKALAWVSSAGLTFSDFDGHGKIIWLSCQIQVGDVDETIEQGQSLDYL